MPVSDIYDLRSSSFKYFVSKTPSTVLNDLGVHLFKAFNLPLAPWQPMKEDPWLSFGLKNREAG